MSESEPRVSIGLPVFNGENYIADTLNSILAQTFSDFELIISDNGSTDRTQKICRAYAAQDSRIRYYRSEDNLGAAWNFNRVFDLSRGKYFEWVAHDDLLAPDFLAKCVAVLEQDPSVVLCYPKARIIDEHGSPVRDYDTKLNTDALKPQDRFRALLVGHRCFEVFGVIRAGALRTMTAPMGNYSHGDGVLLARLSLMGRFHEVPEYLFFPRLHPKQSMDIYGANTNGIVDYHSYAVWFDPANSGRIILPHWKMFQEYFKAVWQVPVSWRERARCYLHLFRWGYKMKHWLKLDLMIAFKQARTHFMYVKKNGESLKENRRTL